MSIPADFLVIEESEHFVMLQTTRPVTLKRSDELYKAGYLVNQITTDGIGGLLSLRSQKWLVICFKLESHGNQKA